MTWIAFDSTNPDTWPAMDELVLVKKRESGPLMFRSFHYTVEPDGTTVDAYDEDSDYDDGLEDAHGILWHPMSEIAAAIAVLKSKGITTVEQYEALIAD